MDFIFNNCEYSYFRHVYNSTGRNERIVEVPIIYQALVNNNCSILEVGNVLSHYYKVNHIIVDLYEIAEGVVNEDICTYNPEKKFNLIVSISTLEHIKTIEQINVAFKNLCNLLSLDGQIWFTIPLNQNPVMDSFLKDFDKYITTSFYLYAMKRVSLANEWEQVAISSIWDCKYGAPYRNANGIIIGNIIKELVI